ncbi:hypothetical protein O3G_MSEX001221 [Manduca sexta]|nr:hypothetical protein O3G_MSEX001221 [Manduca sexta]
MVSSEESSTLASQPKSTVRRTPQRIRDRKNSDQSGLSFYAGKMLIPFLGAGLKLYGGVNKGTSGVKTIASGTYDMADGAFDVVKTSFRRLGGVFFKEK